MPNDVSGSPPKAYLVNAGTAKIEIKAATKLMGFGEIVWKNEGQADNAKKLTYHLTDSKDLVTRARCL